MPVHTILLKFIAHHKYKFALGIIIFLAIFFRFWQITSVPPGLYPDEAMNGVDALDSLRSGNFPVFYPNNNGREGLIIWLDALAIKAFGATPWALRLFPALAGMFAVLGLYFLLKALFDKKIALAGAFFMATGFWAVLFSRIGFRANLMIPILIWSFYFLIRGFNLANYGYNRIANYFYFILGGVLFGFGFYTYIAFRFAPVLALLIFLPILIRQNNKKLWIGAFIFAAATLIVALPIGIYFVQHPADFFGRAGQVSVFSEVSSIKAFTANLAKTLGMFNFVGDFNWRHNFSGSSQLFWPVGILFLFGIYFSARRFQFAEKFLFAWFLVFLFPVVLSSEGIPHALRALALAPVAYALAGIGLIELYNYAQKYFDKKLRDESWEAYFVQLKRLKKEVFALFLIFLFLVAVFGFNRYFVAWAINPETRNAFSENYVKEAEYLKKLPADINKYIIVNAPGVIARDIPMPAMTAIFLLWGRDEIKYMIPNDKNLENIKRGKSGAVVMPLQLDLDLLGILQNKLKNSKLEIIDIGIVTVVIP